LIALLDQLLRGFRAPVIAMICDNDSIHHAHKVTCYELRICQHPPRQGRPGPGDHGSLLKVPLSKLATERTVPLDEPTQGRMDDPPWPAAGPASGLRGRDGQIMHVTPHPLRHTYPTSLKMGNVASSASFGSLCEHAVPAVQRGLAALSARRSAEQRP
jgi:hypothetical protein